MIILFSAFSLTVFPQQKKVAVYMTGASSGISKVLGDQLVAAFSKSDKYIAVERTSSFLAEIGKEQSYQRTGAVSDNDISQLGRQFGVQLVCVVDISDVFSKKYVSARLIDVEKVEVINTANATSSLDSMEELMNVCNTLRGQLFSEMLEDSNIPQGFVDLGLPSGTLWQKKSAPGEILYSTALETCHNNNAEIPSIDDWAELLNECTWNVVNNGYEVVGPNGNKLLLRYTDNYRRGKYWTSTCRAKKKDGNCSANYYFFFDTEEQKVSNGGGFLALGTHGLIYIRKE